MNIERHAEAQHVQLALDQDVDGLRLTIIDDGKGFDPTRIDHPRNGGIGLRNMRERIEYHGGKLVIDSVAGRTELVAILPTCRHIERSRHMTEFSGASAAIRLMLVDDHQLVRDGLRARLGDVPEICIVGEAGNGRDALSLAATLHPNLILVDVRLPDMSGIELTSRLVDVAPDTRIMILSMYDNREYVLSAVRAGACGYVLKDAPIGRDHRRHQGGSGRRLIFQRCGGDGDYRKQ